MTTRLVQKVAESKITSYYELSWGAKTIIVYDKKFGSRSLVRDESSSDREADYTAVQGYLWLCTDHSHEGCSDVVYFVLIASSPPNAS